jgi:hypothetical protein
VGKEVREILTVAKYRWRGVWNDLARSSGQRALAAFLIAVNLFGALFAYRGFLTILAGWSSLGDDEFLTRSTLLLLGILGIVYLLSLVSAAKEFLGRSQIPLLLVAPLKPSSLLWAKYLAVIADRNLEIAVIVLGMPCLAAMRTVGLIHAVYLFPPFLVGTLLTNMAAVATVLLTARYVWQRRKLALGLGMGFLISLLAWIVLIVHTELFGPVPGTILAPLQSWSIRWQSEFAARPLTVTATLTLALVLILWILAWFLGRIYAHAWAKLQETRLVKSKLTRGPKSQTSAFVGHVLSPWQGATRAIFLKDWRTMGRSPLFPFRVLGLFLSWAIFAVVKERLAIQNPLLAISLVVAYVLLCLQATMIEPTANAFAGEANRLSLVLTAPLSPWQTLRAKLIAQLVPALLISAVSTFVIGVLAPLPPPMVGLVVFLACFITAANVALLVGGSVTATDLSVSVSGIFEEILFEETIVSPIAANRMVLTGISLAFQVINVALFFLPYWWGGKFGSLSNVLWGVPAVAFLLLNSAVGLGALRVGTASLNRITK